MFMNDTSLAKCLLCDKIFTIPFVPLIPQPVFTLCDLCERRMCAIQKWKYQNSKI